MIPLLYTTFSYVTEAGERNYVFCTLPFWYGKERLLKEKDVAEKVLEDYEDVFADIVNGLIFKGECVVGEDELEDILPVAQYKAFDAKLHEEERDVAKRWKRGLINIAVLGVENQSSVFNPMPLRVIGYDGASYRAQLTEYDALARKWEHEHKMNDSDPDKNGGKRPEFHPVPVLTIVLYFGNEHWTQNLRLKELLDIPQEMDRFINDYKINVFEVAWLTDEQIARFKSDFKVVAGFFAKKRRNPDYMPDDTTEIRHVDEVLKLISAVSGDERYAKVVENAKEYVQGKEIRNMCDVAERLEKRGLSKGRILQVIEDTCWKILHGYPQDIIEIGPEEQVYLIRKVCAIADKYAPPFDSEKIYDELFPQNV